MLEIFYLLYKIGARKLLKVSPEVAKGDTFRCDWDVGLVCPEVLVNFNFGSVAKLAHEREKMGGRVFAKTRLTLTLPVML